MKKVTKILLSIFIAGFVTSCSDWNDTERTTFDNEKGLTRLVPLLEAKSEEDLPPHLRDYYKELREYRKTPHVKGFGWFGNWTGKGSNPQNYLKALPDSVDFVSIWGMKGNFSKEHLDDLKFFQEVKGGKALLCWIVQNLGDQLTPEGKDSKNFWVNEKGNGNFLEGVKAYANAICDTIEKYNFDGFDIDYEPNYGHSGNMANGNIIESDHPMQIFIETLYKRLNPQGKMLVMDGEPYLLSTETSKMIDHYIYQAYWESSTSKVLSKINRPNLDNWKRKTIITVEFEQTWQWGGIRHYRSSARPELNSMDGGIQFCDYATLDLPGNIRIGGIGSYHMEYDYPNDPPYKWIRKALYYGNQVYKGNFQ